MSVLPFAIIASFPARILFDGGNVDWLRVTHIVGVTGAMFLAMTFLWRAGLRAYSSASS